MSHSKRNTSLAFFTSYERSLLKSYWGSQATRLSRDSFLPFASCRLCLQIARDPVACASNGDVFCRECAVSNLLTQRKEIKRLEKEDQKRRREEDEEGKERGEEEKERAIAEFEQVMMGLEGGRKKKLTGHSVEGPEAEKEGRRPKRKFELDEEEMLRNAKEERAKARKTLDEEKSAKPVLPSFWVPSLTPSLAPNANPRKALKLHPFCPASSSDSPHLLSLKTIVPITFSTAASLSEGFSSAAQNISRICPACKRALNNGVKAMLTIPCGHVICKTCVDRFMAPTKDNQLDPYTSIKGDIQAEDLGGMRCYVCETDLTDQKPRKKKDYGGKNSGGEEMQEKDKERLKPGLVEIAADGTGFAGKGKNMAKREGVAFQC